MLVVVCVLIKNNVEDKHRGNFMNQDCMKVDKSNQKERAHLANIMRGFSCIVDEFHTQKCLLTAESQRKLLETLTGNRTILAYTFWIIYF